MIRNEKHIVDSLFSVLKTQRLCASKQDSMVEAVTQHLASVCAYGDTVYCNEQLPALKKFPAKYRVDVNFLMYTGLNHSLLGRPKQAREYLFRALPLAEAANAYETGRILSNLGNTFSTEGNYVTALQYYIQVMKRCESWDKQRALRKQAPLEESEIRLNYIRACVNASTMYYRLGNLDEALRYAELTLEKLYGDINYLSSQAIYNIGLIRMEQGRWDEAETNFLQCIELNPQTYDYMPFSANKSLAELELQRNRLDKAMNYLNSAQIWMEEYNHPRMWVEYYVAFSNIYLQAQQYEASKEATVKAFAIDSLAARRFPDLVFNAGIADLYLNDKAQAAAHLYEYRKIIKQHINARFRETLAGMNVLYETGKKQSQIKLLQTKQKNLILVASTGGLFLLLVLTFVLFYYFAKMRQKKQEIQLTAQKAILEGESKERKRLSSDLHDGLGGWLSMAKIHLLESKTDQAIESLERGMVEMRRIAHFLMPYNLEFDGLITALDDFCRQHSMVHFEHFGELYRLEKYLEIILYYCAHELINNALKHSGATQIHVQLEIYEERVSVCVSDNGIGFEPEKITHGSGLENIRSRVQIYGGTVVIHSQPGKGAEIQIEMKKLKRKKK
jgi:signal transduction histidine kinase